MELTKKDVKRTFISLVLIGISIGLIIGSVIVRVLRIL
jgi:hypothetical protein|nr:MAG TPA_asm: Ribosome associated membrane protein RAMP4 [Caudoviricetes sp.]